MQETGYAAPHSIEEAIRLLAGSNGKRARVLAGGTDLLVQMRTGQRQASLLVDVKRIPETTALRLEPDGLHLGAAVSAAEIREHPEICEAWPGLVEAAALIGSEQIQGRSLDQGPAADQNLSTVYPATADHFCRGIHRYRDPTRQTGRGRIGRGGQGRISGTRQPHSRRTELARSTHCQRQSSSLERTGGIATLFFEPELATCREQPV